MCVEKKQMKMTQKEGQRKMKENHRYGVAARDGNWGDACKNISFSSSDVSVAA